MTKLTSWWINNLIICHPSVGCQQADWKASQFSFHTQFNIVKGILIKCLFNFNSTHSNQGAISPCAFTRKTRGGKFTFRFYPSTNSTRSHMWEMINCPCDSYEVCRVSGREEDSEGKKRWQAMTATWRFSFTSGKTLQVTYLLVFQWSTEKHCVEIGSNGNRNTSCHVGMSLEKVWIFKANL